MENFNTRFVSLIKTFQDYSPKYPKHKLNAYTDYVEWLCLISNDELSLADVSDRLFGEMEYDNNHNDDGSIRPEIDDQNENWLNSIFDLLEERSLLFGKNYPFVFEEDIV